MADIPVPTEVRSSPEPQLARQEKVGRVALAAVDAKARTKYPDVPGPKADNDTTSTDPLAIFRQLDGDNPSFVEDTTDTAHNLVLQTIGWETKKADGSTETVTLTDGKARIIGVQGKTPDGDYICAIGDENGQIMNGEQELLLPLTDYELKTTVAVAYRKELIDELDGDDLTAFTEHVNAQPQVNLPTDFPIGDAALTQLAEKYGVTDDVQDDAVAPQEEQPVEKSKEQLAVDKMNELITKKIDELQAQEGKLSKDDMKILIGLRMAQILDGETVGLAFKADALRKAGLGNELTQIDPDGSIIDAAEHELGRHLTDFKDKGHVTQDQLDKWKTIADEEGGMAKLMANAEFQKVLLSDESQLCKAMFGKDLNEAELKKLLLDANLPPELKKALESGDKMGILKIILLIIAGVIAAPFAVAGAGVATAVGGVGIGLAQSLNK